jgi:cytochrome d ubiquinol oxidase subunit I
MVSAGLIISVAAWHLARRQNTDSMRPALRFGLWMMVIAGIGTTVMGDQLSLAMVQAQPMKMAAAEALYNTATGADASFSLFTLGTPDGVHELFSIRIPYLLSFLSTHSLNGTVEGINDLQAQYAQLYGPGDYTPIIWITYWSFRWMIALGVLHILVAVVGLWLTRGGRAPRSAWVWRAAVWSFPLSLAAMIVGWVFTEMGRQPWLVFGLLKTADGVSPGVSGLEVLISLAAFTAIYGSLAVVEFRLILKAVAKGPDAPGHVDEESSDVRHPVTVY